MFDGEKNYKVQLIKCPRCFAQVNYVGRSKVSVKFAVQDVLYMAKEHSEKFCFFRNSHPEFNKAAVVIFLETRNETKIKSEWIENNFILI